MEVKRCIDVNSQPIHYSKGSLGVAVTKDAHSSPPAPGCFFFVPGLLAGIFSVAASLDGPEYFLYF